MIFTILLVWEANLSPPVSLPLNFGIALAKSTISSCHLALKFESEQTFQNREAKMVQ